MRVHVQYYGLLEVFFEYCQLVESLALALNTCSLSEEADVGPVHISMNHSWVVLYQLKAVAFPHCSNEYIPLYTCVVHRQGYQRQGWLPQCRYSLTGDQSPYRKEQVQVAIGLDACPIPKIRINIPRRNLGRCTWAFWAISSDVAQSSVLSPLDIVVRTLVYVVTDISYSTSSRV